MNRYVPTVIEYRELIYENKFGKSILPLVGASVLGAGIAGAGINNSNDMHQRQYPQAYQKAIGDKYPVFNVSYEHNYGDYKVTTITSPNKSKSEPRTLKEIQDEKRNTVSVKKDDKVTTIIFRPESDSVLNEIRPSGDVKKYVKGYDKVTRELVLEIPNQNGGIVLNGWNINIIHSNDIEYIKKYGNVRPVGNNIPMDGNTYVVTYGESANPDGNKKLNYYFDERSNNILK